MTSVCDRITGGMVVATGVGIMLSSTSGALLAAFFTVGDLYRNGALSQAGIVAVAVLIALAILGFLNARIGASFIKEGRVIIRHGLRHWYGGGE